MSHSSTSSSSDAATFSCVSTAEMGAAGRLGASRTLVLNATERLMEGGIRVELPYGALWAVLLVVVVHAVTTLLLAPEPLARDDLRQKVAILTKYDRPSLVIAGDSRAAWQVIPDVVAERLGVPPSSTINIGQNACETSEALAVYKEYRDRFAPNPLMLLSVSLFSVDDRAVDTTNFNYAMACTIPFVDRCKLLPPKRMIRSLFMPERDLYYKIRDHLFDPSHTIAERGFISREGIPSRAVLAEKMDALRNNYGPVPMIDGLRWQRMVDDLMELRSMGVQVVVMDTPHSSHFHRALEDSPIGEAFERFHEKLRQMCREQEIPILQYGLYDLGSDDPDRYFVNLNHLNREGAKVLSQVISDDVRQMLDVRQVRLPGYLPKSRIVASANGDDQVTP